MRLIDADELKSKKEYSNERHEWIVPVTAIDWLNTTESMIVGHGKWETIFNKRFDGSIDYACSICRKEPIGEFTKFCPHCGAKMDI